MTGNQIKYWELQERKRSNRTQETETGRHNRATEYVESGKLQNAINTLAENIRHSKATEQQAINELAESRRHNVAGETQAINELAERRRSNIANESLTGSRIGEDVRHNLASETETQRHNSQQERNQSVSNMLTEQRDRYNYDIGSRQAETAADQAMIALRQMLINEDVSKANIAKVEAEASKILSDESLNTYRKAQMIAQAVRDMTSVGKGVADITKILK